MSMQKFSTGAPPAQAKLHSPGEQVSGTRTGTGTTKREASEWLNSGESAAVIRASGSSDCKKEQTENTAAANLTINSTANAVISAVADSAANPNIAAGPFSAAAEGGRGAATPGDGADLETLMLDTASPEELPQVAEVIDEVSEGGSGLLFSGLISGVSPVNLLCMALNSPNPSLYLGNVLVLRDQKGLRGLALCYPASEHHIPPVLRSLVSKSRLAELAPLLEEAAEGSLYLHTLWVSALCRGQHLGELLIEAVCLKAQTAGLTSVSLHCFKSNEGALKFYAAEGFEVFKKLEYTGSLKKLHPEGGVILRKQLSSEASAAS